MNDSHETMRDEGFLGRLIAECDAGRPFVVSSVLATRGSMPRHAGARMVLLADGTFLGTVGGGRVEQIAQERSQAVLAGQQKNSIEWLTHAKTGMACGGDALVSVRHSFDPKTEGDLLRGVVNLLHDGEPFVLCERWADPQNVGIDLTRVSELAAGDPRATSDVPRWDESSATYCEPLGPDPVCYVFGGGHVGRALVPVLASVGFRVVVFDDREGVAVASDFPQAERVLCGDFTRLREQVGVTRRDYVVVTTHGHSGDIDVLEQVLPSHPAYVGCIGSRGKAAFVRKTLVDRGIPAEDVERVHLPIGENILAVTPPEIAISIAAQLIRCRAELRPERPHQRKG